TIPWRRDPVDLFAFHLDIPQGVETLEASFDFLSAIGAAGFSSASSETAHLGIYSWNQVLLYPQGARTDEVMFRASLQIPAGWKFATSLKTASQNGGTIDFAPVSLTTLVDSPVIAGEYLKVVSLDSSTAPGAGSSAPLGTSDTSSRHVEADLVGDTAASIEIPADLTQKWKRLVQEADAMFGARHYDRYHFLLTLSDRVAHFGLEHHQSNDSRVNENSLTQQNSIGVVAHEYVHSWNGKFRRPAGLATADFQQPMVGELLWVYEGLTQYLGYVLAERSGIWSESYYKERLAQVAAYLDTEPGREWRPLADTATAAQLLYFAPGQWTAYRRSTDFYDEGWLIWLDVDTTIRELTHGAKSIEDFCHLLRWRERPADGEALHPGRCGGGAEPGGAARLEGLPRLAHLPGDAARPAGWNYQGRVAPRLYGREERVHQDRRRRSCRRDVFARAARARARRHGERRHPEFAGRQGGHRSRDADPRRQRAAILGGGAAQRDRGFEDRLRAADDRVSERRSREDRAARLSRRDAGAPPGTGHEQSGPAGANPGAARRPITTKAAPRHTRSPRSSGFSL